MKRIEELEKKYEELGEQIKKLKEEAKKIGFKDDAIFLLSIEEYEKYKEVIPKKNCWWWLRSPGHYADLAAIVNFGGSVEDGGHDVGISFVAVRPAIRYSLIGHYVEGDYIYKHGTTWVVLDPINKIAIAENPIHFMHFDNYSNNYEKSDVRNFLTEWYKERKNVIV